MLKNWQSHQDYLNFLHEAKIHFDSSQRVRLAGEFVVAREKLRLLNLDPVMELLDPYDPPLGSYYDFIDRLWLQEKHFQKSRRKDLFSADKNRKPANKPGKGKKLPNRHPEITKIIAEEAVSRDEFPFYYEKLLQQVFCAAAVTPSMQCGLINKGGVTLSGDGTCVHTHASPYGHKVCGCPDHGQNRCDCPRHYSDPDAHWGWDSDLGTFYFGYTLYMLSYHDSQLGYINFNQLFKSFREYSYMATLPFFMFLFLLNQKGLLSRKPLQNPIIYIPNYLSQRFCTSGKDNKKQCNCRNKQHCKIQPKTTFIISKIGKIL